MKRKIYCKNKIIGEIKYQENDEKSDKIIQIIQKKYHLLKNFFGFKVSPIKINLLYSRAEINKYWGVETPIWICGFIKGKNKIYILSPSVSEKISKHSATSIYKVAIHELVHLFVEKINKKPLSWLNEGLALVLANQIKSNAIKKKDWEFLKKNGFINNPKISWKTFENKSGYQASYILVNFLFNHKKEKIKELLNINITNKKRGVLIKEMENILNLTENEFIRKVEKKIKFL